MNLTMTKKNSILSDLVLVILGFNDFPLNMYKTLSNTHINIKILQIQYNKYSNK